MTCEILLSDDEIKALWLAALHQDNTIHKFACAVARAVTAKQAEPAAWMSEDGERVVPASTKATADREGGASASALRAYPIPLYRGEKK